MYLFQHMSDWRGKPIETQYYLELNSPIPKRLGWTEKLIVVVVVLFLTYYLLLFIVRVLVCIVKVVVIASSIVVYLGIMGQFSHCVIDMNKDTQCF